LADRGPARIRALVFGGSTATMLAEVLGLERWFSVSVTRARSLIANFAVGTTPPPTAKFAINDLARVTSTLNLRSSPSTSASVVAVLPTDTSARILAGPRSANGYTWWQIRTGRGTGWAVENWLVKTSGTSSAATPSGYAAGASLVVSDGPLNMRTGPTTSNGVVAILPTGSRITVVSGPTSGSGYTWYQVRSTQYGTGWVVSNFVSPA